MTERLADEQLNAAAKALEEKRWKDAISFASTVQDFARLEARNRNISEGSYFAGMQIIAGMAVGALVLSVRGREQEAVDHMLTIYYDTVCRCLGNELTERLFADFNGASASASASASEVSSCP